MFHISHLRRCYSSGTPHSAFRTPHSERAFTMIEIAVCLAIIGFALVAIIGVLPIGMNVQKDNREETIINQDATVFLNAIRSGAQGVDDLTNYVLAITNYVTVYDATMTHPSPWPAQGYTTTNSSTTPQFPLIDGYRIIGLLSTPKYQVWGGGKGSPPTIHSNHVVAYVRAMSGPALEKFPQNNASIRDLGFSYRLTAEVIPYLTNYYDPVWLAYGQAGLSAGEAATRLNNSMVISNLQNNLHDVRLVFAWPFTAQGTLPKTARSQVFRTLVSGQLLLTNDFGLPQYPLYFFQPRTFVKSP